ncbi:uncharacterized protein DSM5745_04460 [Aspergillus mulundensis]|uniref:NmrA-like domain-containing protein n=1 Tax=Aspergillus mulundensis TaxID=1810919 RepID=A0A3D8SDF7_9EURO|nr:hypothetical protein DSM5745_04460 [Aspergillus mulundensis]RDW84134.1 hypothetical protein DSM5745_04460 [Aspergillus mulundensis]
MSRIGVFPASGGLGSSIVKHLLTLVPASQLTLISRNPEKHENEFAAGATVARGDYDYPETLAHVFEDIDVLMLISYASFEIEHRVNAHKTAINAARKSGVKHIFYSSLAFAGDYAQSSVAHVMGAHLETEKLLAELSAGPNPTTYTSIREGLYSESFPIYTNWFDLRDPSGEITIPHDGHGPGVAWVKRDELGEASARLVANYATVGGANGPVAEAFPFVNKIVLLTGSKVYSLKETAEVLGRAVGRDVRIREIGVDEYAGLDHAGKHTYHGVDLAREWCTAWEAIRRGETAVVTPTLKEILGREPEDYETTIRGIL